METLQAIFQQLGVDASILPQFIVTVIMFILTKFIFFNHLQEVLDTREDKTTKLSSNTDKKFEEINKISNDYKTKIETATKNALQKINTSKTEISKKFDSEYKNKEKEVNDYIDGQRVKVEEEMKSKKEELLNEAGTLADLLVQKITKG